jgi:sugar lactone lactonase YvrE
MARGRVKEARILRASGALVGEGPLWDDARGMLWWVDIKGRLLHCTDPADAARDTTLVLPSQPGSLATCADGSLLVALQEGLVRVDPTRGALSAPMRFEMDCPDNRSNDGKPGPDGAFWVGTMPDRWEGHFTGGLWRLAPGTAPRRVLERVGCPNALCWSPDGRTLYFADSRRRRVMAHAFDPTTGSIGSSAHELLDLATMPHGLPDSAVPDGATVDAQGCIWIAIWDGACILVLSPSGELLHRLELPAQRPTCPAFGGCGLDRLFVTTARYGLQAPGPADGALLVVDDPGTSGLPGTTLAWPSHQPPCLTEQEDP